jgi:hypothetical protein
MSATYRFSLMSADFKPAPFEARFAAAEARIAERACRR